MVVFGTDIFEKLLEEIDNREFKEFEYLDCGACKAVFKFHEHSTDDDYVIKVDISKLPEDGINFINETARSTGKTEASYCSSGWGDEIYDQTAKEIKCYRWLKDLNDRILFLAPTLLKYSDIQKKYSIQVYTEPLPSNFCYSTSMALKDRYKQALEADKIGVDKQLLSNILTYLVMDASDFEESYPRVKKLIKVLDSYEDIWGIDLFDDMSKSNLGMYKGCPVILDYGYY